MCAAGVFSSKIQVRGRETLSTTTCFPLAVQMEAVYIPEDDRCTDILGLVEDEDNLR